MMFCPNCGKETDEDAKFCKDCGKLMPDVGRIAPESSDTPRSAAEPPLEGIAEIGQGEGLDYTEHELQRQVTEQQERIREIRSQMAQERRIRNSEREIRRLEEEELREQERLEQLRFTWEDEAWVDNDGRRGLLSPRPSKNKTAAGIVAIIVGYLGVHKFYLGYVGVGIIYLLLSITFYGLFFTVPASIADGILYLSKSEEDFDRTYVRGRRRWF